MPTYRICKLWGLKYIFTDNNRAWKTSCLFALVAGIHSYYLCCEISFKIRFSTRFSIPHYSKNIFDYFEQEKDKQAAG